MERRMLTVRMGLLSIIVTSFVLLGKSTAFAETPSPFPISAKCETYLKENTDIVMGLAQNMQKEFKKHWRSPSDIPFDNFDKSFFTTVVFQIDKQGKISSLRIQHASGSERYDQSVVDAVLRSQLALGIPAKNPCEKIPMTFQVNRNVLNSGKK